MPKTASATSPAEHRRARTVITAHLLLLSQHIHMSTHAESVAFAHAVVDGIEDDDSSLVDRPCAMLAAVMLLFCVHSITGSALFFFGFFAIWVTLQILVEFKVSWCRSAGGMAIFLAALSVLCGSGASKPAMPIFHAVNGLKPISIDAASRSRTARA